MNLSENKQPPTGRNAGAVPVWGPAHAAPAHPHYEVGAVGFGAGWTMEDSMAASIVRLEQENDELRAEVAMLKEAMLLLAKERDEARFAARAGMTTEEMRADFLKEWRRDT
jgi:hypothetical protein